MLLNLAPNDQAVMSNVGEVGEFRIRNSAKAFNILSSGLYANKVRAIIRELSCNAVDSHVAAGKKDTPFDVHLPNQLEPWFSIRDYGTGLSHDQVTSIYTTYFESTKTDSNDFIGALGLGSKSPFSYTDNFTVTAVKNGVKGIYTAFINDQGVPSIALMTTENTDEPAGVEVKFSVNDRYDFDKFRQEARNVYKYFNLRPVVSGYADFTVNEVEYEKKDIVPGVHSYKNGRSVAIMGNIAYPIEVPEADKTLGELRQLLNCGLEIHFAIGELDFQASREGLSYIPQTINSIKCKLEALNSALTDVLTAEADTYTNAWEKTFFLLKKKEHGLWQAAVKKYITDTKFDMIDATGTSYYYLRAVNFKMSLDDLRDKYNIEVLAFEKQLGRKATSNLNHHTVHGKNPGEKDYRAWEFNVREGVTFIKNDTKIGASARAKYHWSNTQFPKDAYHYQTVYVLNKFDKTKPAKFDAFLADIKNPPNVKFASELMEKERAKSSVNGKNVTIMRLEERGNGGWSRRDEMVWRDAGKADSFDANETYYYLPLSGFVVQSNFGHCDVKSFFSDLKQSGISGLTNIEIYGVRKGDIEFIKTQKNWVNLETHLSKVLAKTDKKLLMSLVLNAVDSFNYINYNDAIVNKVTNTNSPYLKLVNQFKGYDKVRYSESSLKRLCNRYAAGATFSPDAFVQKFVDECSVINKRYPLLQYLRSTPNNEIAEYVNLIDTQKGV